MATIKDIAKIAGVSHGTVSNVLNGRGNVSAKKIKLVEEAAHKLDYQLNAQAKILREGQSNTISVILPNITSEHYAHLYAGLNNYFTRNGYELSLYLTADQKELELQFIQRIAAKRDYAVISVSSLDSAESYYQTLKIDHSNIVFVYREPNQAKQFITLDFELAGQDIADHIMAKNYHQLGLFTNYEKNSHSGSLKKGLLTRFASQKYDITLQHIESASLDNTYSLAFDFFSQNEEDKPQAIITSDIERAHYLRNASYLGSLSPCPTIYSLANNSYIFETDFQQYHMNYGMLSEQIIALIENQSKPAYLKNKGFIFQANKTPRHQSTPQKLGLVILPSPSTEALKKLLPHFKKMTNIDVDIIVRPFNEITTILSELETHQDIDMIRIDMAGLPWFAHDSLKPLSEIGVDLNHCLSHYSPQIIERFSYVNNTAYAIPFDPSIQMLFYRKDLFNDPLIKRVYFEKNRQNLTVPTTFAQYQSICQFFNKRINPESPVNYGGCITLGNTEIIASEFLLRYYAQGGRIAQHQSIAMDKTVALRTLEELRSYLPIADKLPAAWWDESVSSFEKGEMAMLIVYMNLFYYMANKNISPLVGYASVPGLNPLLGGGSIGMSKYSKKNKEVATFFNWLFSDEISEQIVLLGGASARDNIFQNQKIMNSYPWFELAKTDYSIGMRENYLAGDASPINLRLIENIIGKHIQLWTNQTTDSQQTIDNINHELANRIDEII